MPTPIRDKTTQEVAALLDVDDVTVQRWVKAGCPCDKSKGKRQPHKFNETELSKWCLANNKTGKMGRPQDPQTDEESALTIRKLKAQVEKAERENAFSAGKVIDAATEQLRDVAKITTVRNKLCGLGATLSPQLEGLDGAERQTLIDNAVETILKEFSTGE